MKLPFTTEQFLEVFRRYNTTFYPIQAVFLLIAVYAIFVVARNKSNSGKIVTTILAVFWLWMGLAYHIAFFSSINKAAYIFGSLFILQGVLLQIYGYLNQPVFTFRKNLPGIASILLLIYALIIYPIVGYFLGHRYPYSPTFGLPCPTTIFTVAVVLLAERRLPFYIALIPLLWCAVGFSAAFAMGMYEDFGLIVSALILALVYFIRPTFPRTQKNAL
jgi:hypothetical protein